MCHTVYTYPVAPADKAHLPLVTPGDGDLDGVDAGVVVPHLGAAAPGLGGAGLVCQLHRLVLASERVNPHQRVATLRRVVDAVVDDLCPSSA